MEAALLAASLEAASLLAAIAALRAPNASLLPPLSAEALEPKAAVEAAAANAAEVAAGAYS